MCGDARYFLPQRGWATHFDFQSPFTAENQQGGTFFYFCIVVCERKATCITPHDLCVGAAFIECRGTNWNEKVSFCHQCIDQEGGLLVSWDVTVALGYRLQCQGTSWLRLSKRLNRLSGGVCGCPGSRGQGMHTLTLQRQGTEDGPAAAAVSWASAG